MLLPLQPPKCWDCRHSPPHLCMCWGWHRRRVSQALPSETIITRTHPCLLVSDSERDKIHLPLMAPTSSSSTWEAGAGRFRSWRPAWLEANSKTDKAEHRNPDSKRQSTTKTEREKEWTDKQVCTFSNVLETRQTARLTTKSSVLGRLRQENCHECKTKLDYTVNSRLA